MKQQNKIPKLRFYEFADEWKKTTLGKESVFLDSQRKPIKEGDRGLRKGDYPYYGASGIIDYIDDFIFEGENILLGEDGANILNRNSPLAFLVDGKYWVNNHAHVINSKGSNSFLAEALERIRYNKYNTGTAQPKLNAEVCKKIPLMIPSLNEQKKIATFLTAVDSKIKLLQEKKQGLAQYKKGVMQQIFKQELRFRDDNGNVFPEWENRKFADVLFEHKLKSTGKEEVHSVSVHKGVINQIEHLGRSFAAKDTSKYNRALSHDIIYTKSPTGDFPLGIIKQNHIKEDVILSPLYGVFTPETKELGYILHVYFESPINTSNYLSSIIQKGAKNTINITNTTFLSKKMLLPVSKEEQTKIANFLSAIDKNIALVNTKIEHTKSYKKGLLQQMFV